MEKTDEYMAAVHVVIVGFSIAENAAVKRIFEGNNVITAKQISPYLIDQDIIFIESRKKSICNARIMLSGNRPTDGGHLILSPDEKNELICKEPLSNNYIKRFMMGYEFINNVERYSLWLVNVSPVKCKSKCNTK